jgi:large subunit ribosomal protein L6
MSRIGKLPVTVPTGVKAAIVDGVVQVEGPRGKLSYRPSPAVRVVVDAGKVVVSCESRDRQARADYGSTRAHINNMVLGVSTGWKRGLELNGVGFNAKMQGNVLVLSVGFSHEVQLPVPSSVKCTINKNLIELESIEKETVGTFAAKIRKVQPPEPYLGKGIKYAEETIRRKAGKTASKK